MHRIVASITSLELHAGALASGSDAYRPSNCPYCHGCRLWSHGCYHRKADRRPGALGALNPVAIARYLCAACLHTCSRVPLCVAPRRWYDWSAQQLVLLLLLAGVSLRHCSRCTRFERRTIRRWRDWLDQRSEVFVLHLRSRFTELGRESDAPALWRSVINAMGLGVLRPNLIPARDPKLLEVEYGVASRSNGGGAKAWQCSGWWRQTANLSVVNEFAGLIFTIGDGRDDGAGGCTNANGAGISAGAVGF